MKLTKVALLAAFVLTIAACNVFKKGTKSSGSETANAKPENGVYAPGTEEMNAIKAKYPAVTMETLKEGHALYTGVCTGCHEAKNIYKRTTEDWPGILKEMAEKAKITDLQRDAVYKYVLAIKAAKTK